MKVRFLPVLIIFLLMICTSCDRYDHTQSIDKSPVLAKVNDTPITANQFKQKIKDMERHLQFNPEVYKLREQLLKNMISSELIYQKAIKENMHNEPQFKEYLTTHYLKREIPQTEVSDKDARAFFKGKEMQMERVKASHILIKPESKDQNSWDDAEKKAHEVLTKILNGQDFAELAKKYSQDTASARRRGDVGWFPRRGKMVEKFSDAAFELEKVDDVSKVIKTKFGFHIIKLTGSRRGFNSFRDDIKERLSLEKNRKKYEDFIKSIENNADIQIFEEELKNLEITKQPAFTD